jgi:hypothetical protein
LVDFRLTLKSPSLHDCKNVVIIALQAMLLDFARFMSLAVLCFTGIWFALAVLGQETWSKRVRRCIDVFGLSGAGANLLRGVVT